MQAAANVGIAPSASKETCDFAPAHEEPNHDAASIVYMGQATKSIPSQTRAAVPKSVQIEVANTVMLTTGAEEEVRTLTSSNGIAPTDDIAAADGIGVGDGIAATG